MRGSAVSLRLGYLMQCGMKVVKGSQDRYKIKKKGDFAIHPLDLISTPLRKRAL